MYTVILPTIIKTCLQRFNIRGQMFILCQIQRDGFLFADEGWSDYYLKYKLNDIRFFIVNKLCCLYSWLRSFWIVTWSMVKGWAWNPFIIDVIICCSCLNNFFIGMFFTPFACNVKWYFCQIRLCSLSDITIKELNHFLTISGYI